MRTFTKEELAEIIEKHGKWLRDEDGGERADLRYANLIYADLRSANLRYANLIYADLRYANLIYADLRSANLSYADLRYANLIYADLRSANLRYANLSSADLSYADLRYANLIYADLRYANLIYADLRSANLSYADLRSANLRLLVGNLQEIKSIQCDLWMVTYTSDIMNIGCQSHKISEWWDFSDDEIARMDSAALAWWKLWKPILKKIIDVSPATPIVLEESKWTTTL